MTSVAIILISWLPALAAMVIAGIALNEKLQKLASAICAASIGAGFVITMILWPQLDLSHGGMVVPFYDWMAFGSGDTAFHVGFSYFLDPLTMVMLAVVTGIGCLIATYAAGYMKGDPGYWRFFTYMALFIFAMTTLVMADNLVLLFLGWEGVGLCSYLLIGYYYDKPVAVAAAKKAFIVNRVGDFGFLLGIFLCYQHYGTVQISEMLNDARRHVEAMSHGAFTPTAMDLWIPFLLMIGAFGKSAQLPLYVWLPDAMAGPTPVSALVHAATMVTAGVYLIARCIPLFELSPYALPTVATVGALTACFAATIALCNNDLKGVFAYSTVSQLGYMFLGLGVLSTKGAVFHLFTHAFFKALLFLTAGSVMHALAGQLDIRTMGGLRKKMPVTCWLMFAGCLALAGFPFTAGFYSKDTILGDALVYALNHNALFLVLVILGVFTAFLTAFYTFRLWFTVFMGEERYEMGDEHHHAEDAHGEEVHAEGEDAAHDHAHAHEPHEMPWLPMNAPLVILAIGAILAGILFKGPIGDWLGASTANPVTMPIAGAVEHAAADAAHGEHAADGGHHGPLVMGLDAHTFMELLSAALAVLGIVLAAFFFWLSKPLTAKIAAMFSPIVTLLQNKYYVDELYDFLFVQPLKRAGSLFYTIDALIINGLVYFVAWLPSMVGRGVRPAQSGRIQGYGLGMAMGIAIFALLILMAATRG